MLSAFKSAKNILMHSRLICSLEANSMNPGQTSPKAAQSDLGPYCIYVSNQSKSADDICH